VTVTAFPGVDADTDDHADDSVVPLVHNPVVTVAGVGPVTGPVAERIVDATLRCVARWGVAKTTLDDVAREAGCGRATLYRLMPGGRDGLFDAVVATEASRVWSRISRRAQAEAGLEDVLVGVIAESARVLSSHAALRFLIAHEPEALLPHLAFHRMTCVLGTVGALGAPLLAPWLAPGDNDASSAEAAARAAEWVARIVLSYVTSPAPDVDLCDEVSVRRLVRGFVMPGLVVEPRSSLPGLKP
jgi:AcrR family transcriptional regulator